MDVKSSEVPGDSLNHPELSELRLSEVLKALADPTRLRIVCLLAKVGRELRCSELGCTTKQLATHHLRTLREAGVTATREEGRHRYTRLRREIIDLRFPGLLDSVLANADQAEHE